MRGRKTDSEFVAEYIAKSIAEGKFNSYEIVLAAKAELADIDAKIKEVEELRKKRSKIQDVIFSFEKPTKNLEKDYKILNDISRKSR